MNRRKFIFRSLLGIAGLSSADKVLDELANAAPAEAAPVILNPLGPAYKGIVGSVYQVGVNDPSHSLYIETSTRIWADLDHSLVADGRTLKREDYPELYKVIGNTFGGERDANEFRLPDLRGRIIK